MLRKVLDGADEARVLRSVRVLSRLESFAGTPAWKVSTETLCGFFLQVSQGGPTAAAGVWHQLDWWRDKFGMPVPTRDPYAVAFKSAAGGVGIKQAPELPPGALLVVIAYGSHAGQEVLRQFARIVALFTVGCIRFQHQGRSKLGSANGTYLTFVCAMDKVRTGGARRPFEWVVPRVLQQGYDTLGPLVQLYEDLKRSNPAANFLLPDIVLDKEGRTGVFNGNARWDFSRAMSYSKFVDLLQGLLLSLGMARKEVLGVTYNTLRRCIPSIGEAAAFSQEDMQSLSNWTEIVKGADAGKQLKATHPTSRAYAGGKWITAAINRHKAVIVVHMAAHALGISQTIRCDSIPWEAIRQLRHKVSLAETFAIMGPPWALAVTILNQPSMDLSGLDSLGLDALPESKPATSARDSSPSPSSTSSSSQSGSNSSDKGDIGETDLPIPFRACRGGKIHLQQFLQPSGIIPFCRETPFAKFFQEGIAVLEAPDQWELVCRKCKSKISMSVAAALRASGRESRRDREPDDPGKAVRA